MTPTADDLRHLLRRLVFTATPALERTYAGKTPETVVAELVATAPTTAVPPLPDCVATPWSNTALKFPDTTSAQYDALRADQVRTQRRDNELIRQWWISQLTTSAAPLRENLTLFFQTTFGSATSAVEIPHALHGLNARVRALCLGSIPALLEDVILDPAMLIQIGMDEHGKALVSDRCAKLVLDHWTVGAGNYADKDVEELSRALTGWTLQAAPGAAPSRAVDPAADRVARRTGLTPVFDQKEFDARPKTILGATANYDARAAIRFLASQPNTARRFGRLLARHFGVDDPKGRLETRLAETYTRTNGSMEALLVDLVNAGEFWSAETRWSLIKSPAHLAAGACRQLDVTSPPLEEISRWMTASGQTLFDTPNGGEGGWPGQEAWVKPADRLVVRYQLARVLAGQPLQLGIGQPATRPTQPTVTRRLLAGITGRALVARLDPAPGVSASGVADGDVIERVMATPQYQLA
jgi:uncharacterized protein (DUF1800 family)